MDREPVVGIDLGTTNSEIAFVSDGQPRVLQLEDNGIVPSCVGIDAEGRLLVGREARNQYVAAPERTAVSIKRKMGSDEQVQMGDETYSPQEISSFILKALKTRAEQVLKQPVSKAVVTVPAYFTDAQRQATREAGQIAGLEVVRIINEPTAAALAYGSQTEGARNVLVYDLGGGTFDVSVVRIESDVVEVLASTGDTHLGGDDFDRLIVEQLIEHIESELGLEVKENPLLRARLTRTAEAAKIALSELPYARIEEDHIGEVNGEPRHLVYELARRDFEAMTEEHLDRTMALVTRALNDASVRPSELDRILLVGGSTRIPRIAELLSERLGHEPHGEVDPDLCVVLGAAVQAGMEMGVDVDSVLVDITPYTFGTSVAGELYGRPYMHQYVPLIRRNTKLPVTRTEVFYTMHERQDAVEIDVYQGEDPDARKNIQIGTFLFEGLNRTSGTMRKGILITYTLNLDGILEVHGEERASGKEIRGTVENALGQSTEAELRSSVDRVSSLWGEEEGVFKEAADVEVPEEVREVLERAEKALDEASAEDREEMVDLMEDIRDALRERRLEEVESLRQDLDEILF